jgi:RsiW-degrading membrane proteinase PrsW (M82 family)
LHRPMDFELVVIAIAPIVFLAWFIYTRDQYEHEPRRLILKIFLVGAVLVLPVVVVEVVGSLLVPPPTNPIALFLYLLIVVGLVEESSKYFAIRISVYGSPAFKEPMDGLVFGAIAGLGFAAPENLLYVLRHGAALGIVRGVLSVPGHALWGSIIGYYLARQKVGLDRYAGIKGLLIAVILHTLFDYALIVADPLVGLAVAVIIVAAGWVIFFRLRRAALAVSPLRPELRMPSPRRMLTKYCMYCGNLIFADDTFCRHCGAQQAQSGHDGMK